MEPGLPSPPPCRLPRPNKVKEPKVHLKGERFHPAAGEQSPEGDQQPPAESKPSPCLPLPRSGGHNSIHQPKPLCPSRSCSGAVVRSLPSSLALGVDRENFELKPPCNGHHWCPPQRSSRLSTNHVLRVLQLSTAPSWRSSSALPASVNNKNQKYSLFGVCLGSNAVMLLLLGWKMHPVFHRNKKDSPSVSNL